MVINDDDSFHSEIRTVAIYVSYHSYLHETRNSFYTCPFFHRHPYFFSTTENAHANLARRLSLTYKFSEKSTIGASGKERKYPAGSRNRLGGRAGGVSMKL